MLGTMEQRTEGMIKQAGELIEQAYRRGYKAGREITEEEKNNWVDAAYRKGFTEGKREAQVQIEQDAALEVLIKSGWLEKHDKEITISSREEAWETAHRVAKSCFQAESYISDVFGNNTFAYQIFEDYTATDAITKLKEYDEEMEACKGKFSVGDEVCDGMGLCNSVIVSIDGIKAVCMTKFGNFYVSFLYELTKTGKHYDEIENILKKMGEF